MTERPGELRIDGPAPSASAAELSHLGKETFIQSFGHLYEASDLEQFLSEKHGPDMYQYLLDDPDCAVWVAVNDTGKPVGYLVAGPCDLPVDNMPPGAGELMRFYILQESQGGGLGRRMLALALPWLNEHFEHTYLSVYQENFGAQRLYERYGFETVQKYFFMVGDHADPEFIMKRKAQMVS